MARIIFQRPSSGFRSVQGELIKRIQQPLKDANLYSDVVDGIYGRNTENALSSYQQQNGLSVTGKVDEDTWKKLVSPELTSVRERCLQLTADFEGTGFTKIVGNFDGAGLTWGIIGFTWSNGELQRVIKEINNRHPNLIQQAFKERANELLNHVNEQPISLAWPNQISTGSNRYRVIEPWRSYFAELGSFPETQAIQIERTQGYWDIALRDFRRFNLKTELGIALCYDTAVQNGGIDSTEASRIQSQINQNNPTTEQDIRIIISNVVADNSNRPWQEDVRRRKLTIATSRGEVHGSRYEVKSWGLDEVNLQ